MIYFYLKMKIVSKDVESIFPSIVYSIFLLFFNFSKILNNFSSCSMDKQLGVPPPIYIVSNTSFLYNNSISLQISF